MRCFLLCLTGLLLSKSSPTFCVIPRILLKVVHLFQGGVQQLELLVQLIPLTLNLLQGFLHLFPHLHLLLELVSKLSFLL